MTINSNIVFDSKPMLDLSDIELKECSDLFSTSYGIYDRMSPTRPGEQIHMGVSIYKKIYCIQGIYLIRARDGERQVGHAIYIRKAYEPYGNMTWVLQLVVDKNYRRMGIASTLLRAIWGFSDDFAWGLASANPCTVKTLESVTCRKCDANIIGKNVDAIKTIGKDISFVNDGAYLVGERLSQVNTEFFADNSSYKKEIDYDEKLGILKPGHEWLAFTFKSQPINKESFRNHFSGMMQSYNVILRDAYKRMKMDTHCWTKGHVNEVDYMVRYCDKGRVLDLGCGTGRHSAELGKRGFCVTAIDNVMDHVKTANRRYLKLRNVCFKYGDARTYNDGSKYNLVICMFDVIGSYSNRRYNRLIIRNAYNNLEKDGIFILSVMNMELTESLIPEERKKILALHPEILQNLLPSNTMQSTGQIFSPDYLAMDIKNDLIYRKEQFFGDQELPAEYIICDRRYRRSDLIDLLESERFEIMDIRCVQAGHFDNPLDQLDQKAKEICVVCKKM